MIKAVIFDMDGVLIDSNKAWFNMFNLALNHFESRQISKEEFNERVWSKNFNDTSKEYFSADKKEVLKFLATLDKMFIGESMLFDDIIPTLEKLKSKKYKLAVATNTNSILAKSMLNAKGVIKFFDCIITGDKVKEGKPEPDMLLKVIDFFKVEKDEIIFIGDTIWDKIAAEKAGISFIGFGIDGDYRVEKLSEIFRIITNN
jgi:phosphoglycolate phosphatase/AHBA synthesis associated protein